MPNFSTFSNYDENTSFSHVTFGEHSGVLEVEMNELQQIQNTKLKRVMKSIGRCVFKDTNGAITYDEATQTLSLNACIVLADGYTAFIPSASIVMDSVNNIAYIALEEIDADRDSTLYAYGDATASTVTNNIEDPRSNTETTRRKLISWEIGKSSALPNDHDSKIYVKICEIVNGKAEAPFISAMEVKNELKLISAVFPIGSTWTALPNGHTYTTTIVCSGISADEEYTIEGFENSVGAVDDFSIDLENKTALGMVVNGDTSTNSITLYAEGQPSNTTSFTFYLQKKELN